MYSEFITFKQDSKEGFEALNKRLGGVEQRVGSLEKTVTKIELDHGKKLDALFDCYKQHSEQLNRIEKEVSKHEEVILRRIK